MAKILIVEDDADWVETYVDLLEIHEHTVVSASNISDAKTNVLEIQPEIITLDLNLPENSSSAISNFIYETKHSTLSKIIVISGHHEMMSNSDWIDLVDLILTKPVDNQHLIMMIDRLLSS